jgi:hypothetical protein
MHPPSLLQCFAIEARNIALRIIEIHQPLDLRDSGKGELHLLRSTRGTHINKCSQKRARPTQLNA